MRETATILVLALLSLVFPLFRLPPPSGPYSVGTVTLAPARPDGPALQVWYPAVSVSGAPKAPYRPPAPGVRMWLLRHVGTGAVEGAPVRDLPERLPVLLSVPGWGGHRWEITALNQDLASHGYVVAAGDLPHGVADGVDLDAPLDMSTPEVWANTQLLADAKLAIQVGAIRAALDRLLALQDLAGSRISGRLDPQRIGIVGYSFGGATAAQAARDDPRIRAAVNLDGLLFGEAGRDGVPKPYLEMSDDVPEATEAERRAWTVAQRTVAMVDANEVERLNANLAHHGGWFLTILRARHSNFADWPLFLPFRIYTGAGPADPWQIFRIIAGWTRGFFDHVFDNAPMPGGDSVPGGRVQFWPPSAVTPAAAPTDSPARASQ